MIFVSNGEEGTCGSAEKPKKVPETVQDQTSESPLNSVGSLQQF